MWRSLFWAIALLNFTNLWSLAKEPGSIVVFVPAPEMAAKVSAKISGVRIGILQVHPVEPDEVINARAIALRHATHLVFDHSRASLRQAMFRERLQMQGGVCDQCSTFVAATAQKCRTSQLEQPVNLLAQVSINQE